MNLSYVQYTDPKTEQVSDTCPNCGADLRAPNALKSWVLIDLRRDNVTYDETQDDHVDWTDATWGSGGDLHQPLEWRCSKCDACVCPTAIPAAEANEAATTNTIPDDVCDACGGSGVLFDTGLSQVERCDACAKYQDDNEALDVVQAIFYTATTGQAAHEGPEADHQVPRGQLDAFIREVEASIDSVDLDDLVHQLKSGEASEINNEGTAEQVAYLVRRAGLQWVRDAIAGLTRQTA